MGYPNKIGFYRDGLYRRGIRKHSSGIYDYNLKEDESGTVFHIQNALATSFHLPKISSKWLGLEYTFYVDATTAANFRINVDNDSSAAIYFGYTAAIDVHSTIIPESTASCALSLTAISSAIWMAESLMSGGGTSHVSTAPSWSFCSWSTG